MGWPILIPVKMNRLIGYFEGEGRNAQGLAMPVGIPCSFNRAALQPDKSTKAE